MTLPILEDELLGEERSSCTRPRRKKWRPRRFWTWSHRLAALAFTVLLVASHLQSIPQIRGAPTAATWLNSIPVFDPLALIEVTLASGQATSSMILGAAFTVVLAVIMGRVFCGWICPLGLVLDLCNTSHRRIRSTAKRLGWKIPTKTLPKSVKYWSLACCLGISITAGVPIFTSISPINLTILGAVWWPWYLAGFLLFLSAIELIWPRVFCRAICPLGALYSLLGSRAPLRVRVVGDERIRCRQCVMHCPMGIDVMNDHVLAGKQMIDDPECTRCGVCTDVCHGDILRLRWSNKIDTSS